MENQTGATIQMMHRIGALASTALIGLLIYFFRSSSHLKSSLMLIGSLLIVQITLGILIVLLSLPMAIAVLHNVVALLLLISIVTLIHKVLKTVPN